MGSKTKAWAVATINKELRNTGSAYSGTPYLALYTTATDEDSAGTEVVGGSYSRKAITFASPGTGRTSSNSAEVRFTNMPACTVGWAAIHDGLSGAMMYQGPLTVAKTFAGGETLVFAVGDIAVNFS